eukprot:1155771-Pelagomonas_calceolata.AAC.3
MMLCGGGEFECLQVDCLIVLCFPSLQDSPQPCNTHHTMLGPQRIINMHANKPALLTLFGIYAHNLTTASERLSLKVKTIHTARSTARFRRGVAGAAKSSLIIFQVTSARAHSKFGLCAFLPR